MVYLLTHASMVLTDSGGIQEEAVSLGIPVLVLREKTERMEGVLSGGARLVGSDPELLCKGIEWALRYTLTINHQSKHVYGDGHAAEKIVAFIQSCFDTLQNEHGNQVSFSPEEPFEIEKRDADVKKYV
jgi:UDP-N-acetylglucosamine 2-epimerase